MRFNYFLDSPVSPMTSIVPLLFVISITAAKQAYENILKWRADNMVNKSMVIVIRNGVEEEIKCEDIQQGDLVKVSRDCDVPCDLVLIKSSEQSEKCFMTTANLDGETNLKTLLVPKGLPSLDISKLHTLGYIECEQSKTDLYSFNGRIDLNPSLHRISQLPNPEDQVSISNSIPLMADNLMLRGSRVKNTEWGIGCAIYIGANTKLALNSKLTISKMTSSEKFINKYLVFFLVLLISAVTISYLLKL
jgi:phospholipid-translocating ATPase